MTESVSVIRAPERYHSLGKSFGPIQSGGSTHVPVVSIYASTFLTITQASFQQMFLLTSIAWHQVRIPDREPNCLKAIGGWYLQAPLYCSNLYVPFLLFLDKQLTDTEQITFSWNSLFFASFLLPLTSDRGSCVRATGALTSLYHHPGCICFKLDNSCPPDRDASWKKTILYGI